MSQLLERDTGLTVLRLRFGLARAPSDARSPHDDDEGAASTPAEAPSKWILADVRSPGAAHDLPPIEPVALGLPRSFEDARRERPGELAFTLPREFAATLRALLDDRLDQRAPLWLEMAAPSGVLPLVPWEQLLGDAIDVPIFRLPCFAVASAMNIDSLDLVFCASSPVAKQPIDVTTLVTALVRQTIEAAPAPRMTLHVFADARARDGLLRTTGELARRYPQHRIRIYDSRRAPSALFAAPRMSGSQLRVEQPEAPVTGGGDRDTPHASREIRSPWLQWMMQELGDQGVDGVQFLAHGYLAIDGGMLALAESPGENRDTEWARFVAPKELAHFLTRVGAWYVGFAAPPMNFSSPGLRLLADQTARLHVGPVVLHDFHATDDDDRSIGTTLRFLAGAASYDEYAAHWSVTSRHPTVYCHPQRSGSVQAMELANIALSEHTLLKGTAGRQITAGDAVPAWLLSAQRGLERSTGELLELRGGAQQQSAASEGVGAALKFISNVITANADQQRGEPSDGGVT